MSLKTYPFVAYGFTVPTMDAYALLGLEPSEYAKDSLRDAGMDLMERGRKGKIGATVQYGEYANYEEALIFDLGSQFSLGEDEQGLTALKTDGISEEFLKFAQEQGATPQWYYWVELM